MKIRTYLFLSYLLLVLAGAVSLVSCGGDDIGEEGENPQNKQLVGTKWTTTNWDYGIGDDWVSTIDETSNIYFYSQTEGIFYYSRKDSDSDFGSSRSRCVAHFTYNVEGHSIKLNYINNPMNFSSTLDLSENTIAMNGINFNKGTIDSSDNTWINTLKGTTGHCKWYYDLSGSLYVRGEGDMADYTSFSNTPWGRNNRIPNYVEIMEGVTSIGAFAFANPSIGEVYICSDAKLRKIGSSAFKGTCISNINLPNEITVIGESAFADCNYLTKAYLPDMIEEIGAYAFSGCKSASLTLTKNLRRVGDGAFMGCNVTSWTDSKVLEYIGNAAFTNIKISEVDLPSIKELGHIAFSAASISKIHVGPYLQKVTGTPFYCASTGTLTIDVDSPLPLEYDFVNSEYVKKWSLIVPKDKELYYLNAPYWNNFKSVTGGNGTGTDNGTVPNGIIQTVDAVPGAFEVKLYGRLGDNIKEGKVSFRVSRSSNFTDCVTTPELSVAGLADRSYEITLSGSLECSTKYYYQAVYKYNGSNIKYGETKAFTTLRPQCPSNLSYTINGTTYKMILVSGGADGDFYIMQTELPHSIGFSVAGEHIPRVDASGDGVVIKSEWRKFIDNLRVATGIAWRLPTSAEWKYAAKGGNLSKGTTYSGSNTISEVAWFSGNSSKYVHDGALKRPNELGIYDMSGNYAELTFGKDLYDVDGPFYGGCWDDASSACTVTSYKAGLTSGKIPGTSYKEKNAFNGKYITVRLVYSAE